MKRLILPRAATIAGAALLVVPAWSAGAGAESLGRLEITVEPDQAEVLLGETVDIAVTIRNSSDETTEPLVVHIDITDPLLSGSVDPEDWTATLTKDVGAIRPGESKLVRWTVQPISGGRFVLYAVALAPGAPDVASSNVLTIDVAAQRSLNPEGILPVALGMPILVGALWVFQASATRRRERT